MVEIIYGDDNTPVSVTYNGKTIPLAAVGLVVNDNDTYTVQTLVGDNFAQGEGWSPEEEPIQVEIGVAVLKDTGYTALYGILQEGATEALAVNFVAEVDGSAAGARKQRASVLRPGDLGTSSPLTCCGGLCDPKTKAVAANEREHRARLRSGARVLGRLAVFNWLAVMRIGLWREFISDGDDQIKDDTRRLAWTACGAVSMTGCFRELNVNFQISVQNHLDVWESRETWVDANTPVLENQTEVLQQIIPRERWDLACILGNQNEGGIAYVGSILYAPANNWTALRDARTNLNKFWKVYCAHELGHVMGMWHTFCCDVYDGGNNLERNTGNTIMGYGGFSCGNESPTVAFGKGDNFFTFGSIMEALPVLADAFTLNIGQWYDTSSSFAPFTTKTAKLDCDDQLAVVDFERLALDNQLPGDLSLNSYYNIAVNFPQGGCDLLCSQRKAYPKGTLNDPENEFRGVLRDTLWRHGRTGHNLAFSRIIPQQFQNEQGEIYLGANGWHLECRVSQSLEDLSGLVSSFRSNGRALQFSYDGGARPKSIELYELGKASDKKANKLFDLAIANDSNGRFEVTVPDSFFGEAATRSCSARLTYEDSLVMSVFDDLTIENKNPTPDPKVIASVAIGTLLVLAGAAALFWWKPWSA